MQGIENRIKDLKILIGEKRDKANRMKEIPVNRTHTDTLDGLIN